MDIMTDYVAPRTCTIVNEGEAARDSKERSAPLCDYSNSAAFVLIAEPGAGQDDSIQERDSETGRCVCHSTKLSGLR